MPDMNLISKVLRDAMKSGKYTIGAKETLDSIKGSKLIICARSIPSRYESRINEEAKRYNVPILRLDKTSIELARIIGKPYRVSAISLRALQESDLKALIG